MKLLVSAQELVKMSSTFALETALVLGLNVIPVVNARTVEEAMRTFAKKVFYPEVVLTMAIGRMATRHMVAMQTIGLVFN